MPITEISNKLNSPRRYCPNCTQPLPLDTHPYTFCSRRCMKEFDATLTLPEWDELEEEIE